MKETEKRVFFNQVYQENKALIFRLCRGFLGSGPEAEDLFQEIFLKVWDNLESFQGQSKISTWIYRIGTNTALLYQKRDTSRRKRERAFIDDSTDRTIASPFEMREKSDYNKQLNELLRQIAALSEMDRIIITMVLEGFSYREISEISGLKVNHVGVRINRIKKQLKKKIKVS